MTLTSDQFMCVEGEGVSLGPGVLHDNDNRCRIPSDRARPKHARQSLRLQSRSLDARAQSCFCAKKTQRDVKRNQRAEFFSNFSRFIQHRSVIRLSFSTKHKLSFCPRLMVTDAETLRALPLVAPKNLLQEKARFLPK